MMQIQPYSLSLSLRRSVRSLLVLACLLVSPLASAQESAQTVIHAIVNLRAEVPPTARLAPVLGTYREGSGVVIDRDGLVLTIGYLILEASDVVVTNVDGDFVPAKVVAYDYDTGFGLVRATEPLNISPIEFADSGQVDTGAEMMVVSKVGNQGLNPVRVVDVRTFPGYWEYLLEQAIFTAPPTSGFAGAALVNREGELVGVGSLVVGEAIQNSEQTPGNMFVPIDALKPILDQLKTYGRREGPGRPWVGVYTEMSRGHLFITRLASQGPADKAGLRPNDIITAVDAQPVSDMAEFFQLVWSAGDAGVEVELSILREGDLIQIKLKTEDRYDWLKLNPISRFTASR